MRKPGQRMPVRRRGRGECPLDGAPAQAAMDVRVRGDVIGIVQDEKGVPGYWAVERDGCCCQQNAENYNQLLASEEWRCSRTLFRARLLAGLGAYFRGIAGAAHAGWPWFSIGAFFLPITTRP